jgi:AmmeMemoRadiSam system protein B
MNATRKLIRPALGAGKWFPGNRDELAGGIRGYLDEAHPPDLTLPLAAVIAPHAGYLYSGPVAGYAYQAIRAAVETQGSPETVIVLGFSHRGDGQGVALMDGTAFSTPLGETGLDADAAALLTGFDRRIRLNYPPHSGEHSLENQVPFIQTVVPDAKLVMALIADRDAGTLTALAQSLEALAAKKKILVVASSDMLHDASYELVRKTDQQTLRNLVAMDVTGLLREWDYGRQILCGIGPVVTAITYALGRGVKQGTLLRYRNSGDDHPKSRGQWVVGYGAVAFAGGKHDD